MSNINHHVVDKAGNKFYYYRDNILKHIERHDGVKIWHTVIGGTSDCRFIVEFLDGTMKSFSDEVGQDFILNVKHNVKYCQEIP